MDPRDRDEVRFTAVHAHAGLGFSGLDCWGGPVLLYGPVKDWLVLIVEVDDGSGEFRVDRALVVLHESVWEAEV